jgi:hypothetical protein
MPVVVCRTDACGKLCKRCDSLSTAMYSSMIPQDLCASVKSTVEGIILVTTQRNIFNWFIIELIDAVLSDPRENIIQWVCVCEMLLAKFGLSGGSW